MRARGLQAGQNCSGSGPVTQDTDVDRPSNGNILVADDDVTGQLVTSRVLELAGYDVGVVADGQQVIKALESSRYDLVVMDCMMPVMDGFEATRAIRNGDSKDFDQQIPIIALTALGESDDQQKCLDAGMDAFVSKPVDTNMLITTVAQCLGRASDEAVSAKQGEDQAGPDWDDAFMDDVIDKFLQEIPQIVASLRTAFAGNDVGALENISHRLRGSAEILGASTLATHAGTVERAAKAENNDLVTADTPKLIEELLKLTTDL